MSEFSQAGVIGKSGKWYSKHVETMENASEGKLPKSEE